MYVEKRIGKIPTLLFWATGERVQSNHLGDKAKLPSTRFCSCSQLSYRSAWSIRTLTSPSFLYWLPSSLRSLHLLSTHLSASSAAMSGKSAWYDAYPPPQHTSPSAITRNDLLALLQSGKRPGKDFLLVDLRRNDHEVRPSLFPSDCQSIPPNSLCCLLLAQGWYDQRLCQSACAEPVLQSSHSTKFVSKRGNRIGDLVLW